MGSDPVSQRSEPLSLTHPSPNFGPRRDGLHPELIVIHYTAMQSAKAALERLCDPVAEVSAHYLIAEDGTLYSLVAEDQRAWHAGAGGWGGREDVNSRSIGIELANTGAHPFPEPQMVTLEALLPQIMTRWGIGAQGVIGHSDMAPERKFDPGTRFDWQRLARQGLSVWPQLGRAGDFVTDARRFGYPDAPAGALLQAFRQRFRPFAKGPLDDTDRALMGDLATRFPVDQNAGLT